MRTFVPLSKNTLSRLKVQQLEEGCKKVHKKTPLYYTVIDPRHERTYLQSAFLTGDSEWLKKYI